jgi:hypothetical protein
MRACSFRLSVGDSAIDRASWLMLMEVYASFWLTDGRNEVQGVKLYVSCSS